MLKDRRLLLEQEIKKAHAEAANMYLSIVVSNHAEIPSPEYQAIRDRISKLQFDLNMVNQLIFNGHQ
jgi:hypothetical protein